MTRKTYLWLFIIILGFTALLRLFWLGKVPASLYWEEVALGYDAFSIIHTGKDFHGNSFPVVSFPSFGDFKPSLYFYALAPLVGAFGLQEWVVRLPSALAGICAVALLMIILRKNKSLSLLAGTILSIQPWHLHISRVGFETNVATTLVLGGIFCAQQARKKIPWMFGSILCFVLSMYTYHSTRLLAPLFMLLFLGPELWFWYKKIKSKVFIWIALAAGLCLLMLFPLLTSLTQPEVTHRLAETSIFGDGAYVRESNARIQDDGNTAIAKLMYHRWLMATKTFVSQASEAFSWQFLFLSGDSNLRHGSMQYGALHWWELVTVIIGLGILLNKRSLFHWQVLIWILLATIPAGLTTVSPHALRSLVAAPAFAYVSAPGLLWILLQIKSWKGLARVGGFISVASVICVTTILFFLFYFVQYGKLSANEFQYGYKELFSYLESQVPLPTQIRVSRYQGRPSMYALFYTQPNIYQIQKQDSVTPKDQQELLQVGRYTFGDTGGCAAKTVCATSANEVPDSAKVHTVIYDMQHQPVWVVWSQE